MQRSHKRSVKNTGILSRLRDGQERQRRPESRAGCLQQTWQTAGTSRARKAPSLLWLVGICSRHRCWQAGCTDGWWEPGDVVASRGNLTRPHSPFIRHSFMIPQQLFSPHHLGCISYFQSQLIINFLLWCSWGWCCKLSPVAFLYIHVFPTHTCVSSFAWALESSQVSEVKPCGWWVLPGMKISRSESCSLLFGFVLVISLASVSYL